MTSVRWVPCVVQQELTDPRLAQQVCAVLLQTVRFRIRQLHIEVHSHHPDELDAVVREAQTRLRITGGPGVRHSNDTVIALADPEASWLALLVYAGWCRYLAAFDETGMRIATFHDGGSGLSIVLLREEIYAVQKQIKPLTLAVLQEAHLAVLEQRRLRHLHRREEQHRRRREEIAATQAQPVPSSQVEGGGPAGRGSAGWDPQELAAAPLQGWRVTVSAEVVPRDLSEQAPAVAVGLGTITPPAGATARQERCDLPGHFGLSVAFQPPDSSHFAVGRLEPGAAVLNDGQLLVVADVPGGPAVDFDWPPPPPEYGGAGAACRAAFPGWLITVAHAAAGTVHLSAPLSWTRHDSSARGTGRPVDGTCHLTLTLAPPSTT
ncbi:hypothetical protein [Kineococcus sp. SYSU DK005]|uniref:hypothetical protein n=1 Tax=Kineococcus sp. SYSU DK005 TaxID=3383126 RepID=UPI003D7C88F8